MFDIKITKINGMVLNYPSGRIGYTAVHFKINGECYYLWTGSPEYEDMTILYKGRNKCHLQKISMVWFIEPNLIRFTRKKGCLKYVDTEHFVNKLKEYGLWKGELELL